MPIKILLVDDHPLFRKGLRHLLEDEADIQVVGEAANGREAIDSVGVYLPDVVIMDITMPDFNGIEATRQITAEFPNTKVVALSIHDEQRFVQEMLQAGASGYILKDSVPEEMIAGIRSVIQGNTYLSESITGIVVSEYVKVLSSAAASDEEPLQEQHDLALLRSKLHPPRLTRNLVPRTNLVEKIEDLRRRPLTLVSAAAGYGKSTMASLWLKAWNGPYGWVSLDENDNDLRIFMTYFLAAIQSSQGAGFLNAFDSTQSLLQAPNLPPYAALYRHFLNDLDEIESPFVLVLDDYHKISDRHVHELMSELLVHPPENMHLILLTRRDPPLPISKMRGMGQVNEIGIADLRFTVAETTLFFKQRLQLSIDETAAAIIHEKLEGWAAGMQLMSHSLGNPKDMHHILAGLQGNIGSIVEYLIAEVLSQQSPEMAGLIVQTALLNRFCAPLCDALQGRDTGSDNGGPGNGGPGNIRLDGEKFIAYLKKNNLFLLSLDAENRWFRYHHLFQNLLLDQLKHRYSVQDISDFHSRASQWFARNGFIDEAIRHSVAGDDMPGAAHLAEQHRQAMLNSNRWYGFEKWLAMLPDTEIEQRPELMMARVWNCYYQSKNATIPPILAAIESLLSNGPKEHPLYGEIYLFKAVFKFWQGDISGCWKYIKDALERIPETQPMVRGFAEMYFGLVGCMNEEAENVLPVLFDLLDDASMELPRKLRVMVTLIWVHFISGDLVAASTRNMQLKDVSIKNNSAVFHAWSLYHQGVIHFCRSEFDSAIHYLSKASRTGYLILKRANVDCLAGLTLAYQAMQLPDKANETIERVFEDIDLLNDPTMLEIASTCKNRLSLMRGEAVLAAGVQKPEPASEVQPMIFWLEVPAITNCRVLLAQGSDTSLKKAEKRLEAHLALNRMHHNTFRIIEIMALQSQAVYRQGRLDEALALLGQAITLAEPGGWVQPFVELGPPMAELLKRLHQQNVAGNYIERILAAFDSGRSHPKTNAYRHLSAGVSPAAPDRSPPPPQPLVEPLTNRELDILELLVQRLQNKEIADKLCISNETVKGHLKNIYQKLAASNRRQAVQRAKELGVLE